MTRNSAVLEGHPDARRLWHLSWASLGLGSIGDLRVQLQVVPRLGRRDRCRPILVQADVAILPSSAGGGRPRLSWGPGLGEAAFDATTGAAHVVLSAEGLERLEQGMHTFGMMVLIFLLRQHGMHHVHGATLLDPRGAGWLIVGPSGVGKSTTTALLARAGWKVGGDDAAFLLATSSGVAAMPLRGPTAIRSDAREMFALDEGRLDARRGKWVAHVPDANALGPSPMTPRVLALLELASSGTTRSATVSRAVAMTRLLTDSPWVFLEQRFADEHFTLLERVVRGATCIRLQVGRDLPDVALGLHELVDA